MVLQLLPSHNRHRCQNDEQAWGPPTKAQRASEESVNVLRRRHSHGQPAASVMKVIGCAPCASGLSAPSLDKAVAQSNLPFNVPTRSNPLQGAMSSDLASPYSHRENPGNQRGSVVDPMLLLLPLRVLCPNPAANSSSSPSAGGSYTSQASAGSASGSRTGDGNPGAQQHLSVCLQGSAAQLAGRAAPSPRRPAANSGAQQQPNVAPGGACRAPGAPSPPPASSACPALPSVFPLQRGLTTSDSGDSIEGRGGGACSSDPSPSPGSYHSTHAFEAKAGGVRASGAADPQRLPPGCDARRVSQGDGDGGGAGGVGRLAPPLACGGPAAAATTAPPQQQHQRAGCAATSRAVETLPSIAGTASAPGQAAGSPPDCQPGFCSPKGAAGPSAEARPLVVPLRLPSLTSAVAAPVCRSQAASEIAAGPAGLACRSSSWVVGARARQGEDPCVAAALGARGLSGAIA